MEDKLNVNPNFPTFKFLKYDLPSGLVVFLVALPLCLGIALASGAPLFAGLITGIVGGLVVSVLSGSQLAVSGPAAGLTVIVLDSIKALGSYEAFLFAVVLGGVFQVILGFLRAGVIGNYFPSSVIKGMLAAIGLILILKQIPHAFGYDADYEGDFSFVQPDNENTFSELINAINKSNLGATIISVVSLAILLLWETKFFKKVKLIPGGLVVVVVGILMNYLFGLSESIVALNDNHLVTIPVTGSLGGLVNLLDFPDFSGFRNYQTYLVAGTLALVASLETLLSIEAIDKIDPMKRKAPTNRELKAQGVGNIVAGLIGGLPLTAVIVRGATNVNSGAKTKTSAFLHGCFLLLSVLFIPTLINQIPLASLAAILLMVGYKLTKISLYKEMFKAGYSQFLPFIITIVAIVLTDLLIGIGIGMAVGIFFILRNNMKHSFSFSKIGTSIDEQNRLVLAEEVSFLNKPGILESLEKIPENGKVIIDGRKSKYIDFDVLEMLRDFKANAQYKNIDVKMIGIKDIYEYKPTNENMKDVHESYNKLFENNKKWVQEKLSQDPNYFKNLAKGQAPKYLFIGCSDSRVPANEITGTDPGEMFVHRNIANLVVHTDMNLLSVLQYSIEVLKVEHVIVCGHYGCGGVKAAMENDDHGLIDKWLRNIKDVYRIYKKELEEIQDMDLRTRRLVELNVREQVYHLCMTSIVQKAWDDQKDLHVHGWVYDISEGAIKDLKIDIENDFEAMEVYRYNM